MIKVGDNLTVDDAGILNVNLSNYYTKTDSDNKYALKTEINNPEQKTEITTNSIAFKKNISIYKIEVANATTFTFDFSQLDENNCYTFELWVSMSTPVTLTFPSADTILTCSSDSSPPSITVPPISLSMFLIALAVFPA